jgi:hypothetical protein
VEALVQTYVSLALKGGSPVITALLLETERLAQRITVEPHHPEPTTTGERLWPYGLVLGIVYYPLCTTESSPVQSPHKVMPTESLPVFPVMCGFRRGGQQGRGGRP